MNTDQAVSFVHTRYRNTDNDTSKEAAKHAKTGKASRERIAITQAVKQFPPGLTAYEVADLIGVDRQETSRRISECGLTKTKLRRDGCAVWVAV